MVLNRVHNNRLLTSAVSTCLASLSLTSVTVCQRPMLVSLIMDDCPQERWLFFYSSFFGALPCHEGLSSPTCCCRYAELYLTGWRIAGTSQQDGKCKTWLCRVSKIFDAVTAESTRVTHRLCGGDITPSYLLGRCSAPAWDDVHDCGHALRISRCQLCTLSVLLVPDTSDVLLSLADSVLRSSATSAKLRNARTHCQ